MTAKKESIPRKYLISVRTEFGHVGVSADSVEEAIQLMEDLPRFKRKVEEKIKTIEFAEAPPSTPVRKKELEGIVRYTMEGKPTFLVSLEPLNRKERVGLVLFALDPKSISSSEVADIISTEWKPMDLKTASAYLTGAMKELVYTIDKRYKLTGKGKSWVKNEVLPKIRAEKSIQGKTLNKTVYST